MQHICVPKDLLMGSCDMFRCTHWHRINDYYGAIVDVLRDAVVLCVPRFQGNFFKSFGNDE